MPLYTFTGGTDGANPVVVLAIDSQDNFYGTTFSDGVDGIPGGTAYRLTRGAGGIAETVLHTFTASSLKPFDGGLPYGDLCWAHPAQFTTPR